MSAIRAVTIFCDAPMWPFSTACGAREYTADNAENARADAKRNGWLVAEPGGKDYCPDCVRAGRVPAPPAGGATEGSREP